MARLELELPENSVFTCEQVVRVTDLNYANHLGNDAMISLLQEARCQMLLNFGFSESNIEGLGLMVTDLAIIYKAECFGGDQLSFDVGVTDFNKYGCDITYRITKDNGKTLVAKAKNGVVFFDYHQRQLALVPDAFRTAFELS